MPLESLPQPTALARVANRRRHRLRPEDPNTLDFTLSHEHLPTGFLQRDIIYYLQPMLELLSRANCWYCDETSCKN